MFDLAQEIRQANEDYFSEASAHDRAEHARKFAIAYEKVMDDARRSANFHVELGYYGQPHGLLGLLAAVRDSEEGL